MNIPRILSQCMESMYERGTTGAKTETELTRKLQRER